MAKTRSERVTNARYGFNNDLTPPFLTPPQTDTLRPMAQNVEIKARLRDRVRVVAALKELNATGPTELRQTDVFFVTPNGRLKLRTINATSADESAELIYYDRPDAAGPKTSDYVVVPVPDPAALREALARAVGERAVVEKVRTLYLIGPTRVHLDVVKGLGDYLELEVVLDSPDGATAGQKIADDLLRRFGIDSADLISGAYVDLAATIR